MLRLLLEQKNLSLYHLEKSSHISHATLNDIYNEKYNIDNCSISILYRIAKALDISVDKLYEYLSYNDLSDIEYDDDFDLFKSNALQMLKKSNEKEFCNKIKDDKEIENLYENKKYTKSLYLLSLIDYLSIKNNWELDKRYNNLRMMKLDRLYVSKSIYLLLASKVIKITDVYKNSIKTFLKYNILEAEIDSVV